MYLDSVDSVDNVCPPHLDAAPVVEHGRDVRGGVQAGVHHAALPAPGHAPVTQQLGAWGRETFSINCKTFSCFKSIQ